MRHDQDLFWPFLALLLAALLWPAAAQATTTWVRDTGWVLQPNSNGVYEVLPQDGRGGQHTTTCTPASCQRTGSVTGPLGNPKPTLSPYANFDKAALARGALNLGTRALPWLSLGYGLYDWYTSAGIQQSADGLTGADPYNPAVFGSGIYQFNTQPDKRLGYGTRDAACQAYNAYRVSIGMVALTDIYARLANGIWYCSGRLPDGSNSSTAAVITAAPSTSCPFGTANAQGQCPYTAQQQPISAESALSRLVSAPVTADQLKAALQEILDAGGSLQSTGTGVTGPASAPGSVSSRTETSPTGAPVVVTTTTIYNYAYNNTTVTVTEKVTTTNPDGSTVEHVTPPQLLCGVLDAPPCNVRVDETGTPSVQPFSTTVFGELAAQDAAARDQALSSVPQPTWGFINAPPLAACRPFQFPYDMGSVDACSVVEPVRAVMAYLWALAGAWLCLGWIRTTITGGA